MIDRIKQQLGAALELTKADAITVFELIDEAECARREGNCTVDLLKGDVSIHCVNTDDVEGVVPNGSWSIDEDGWLDVFLVMPNPNWLATRSGDLTTIATTILSSLAGLGLGLHREHLALA